MGSSSSKNNNKQIVQPPSTKLCVTGGLKRAAQQYPNNVCTLDAASGRTKTYKEIVLRISKIANGLQQLGLSNEGRVAVVMLNSDKYFESFFIASW